METHIKVVAVLNTILGAMGVISALIVLLIFGGIAGLVRVSGDADAAVAAPLVGGVGGILFAIVLTISLPVLIGGIALLRRVGWSRIYMIVVSAIELINVPFGTALGIYSIWTLTKPESAALFEAARHRAAP
jgi:hypothetical protein